MPTKFINTPFKKYASRTSKQTRIIIPQPVDKPLYIQGSTLRKEEMRGESDWYTLHKRGLQRPYTGTDPLQERAIPYYRVKGTLPERIVYKYLVDILHFHPDSDFGFDFQSSLDGGRLSLGGLVVDFLFEQLKLILQIQGYTHTSFLRGRKDEEQKDALAAMGYYIEELWEEEIYDLYIFENKMREIFGLRGTGGTYGYVAEQTSPQEDELTEDNYLDIYNIVVQMKQDLIGVYPA